MNLTKVEQLLRGQESLLYSLNSNLAVLPHNERLLQHRRNTIAQINELRLQLPCQCGSGHSREHCQAEMATCG